MELCHRRLGAAVTSGSRQSLIICSECHILIKLVADEQGKLFKTWMKGGKITLIQQNIFCVLFFTFAYFDTCTSNVLRWIFSFHLCIYIYIYRFKKQMKVVKKIGFLVKTDTYLNKPGLRTQVLSSQENIQIFQNASNPGITQNHTYSFFC